MGPGTGRGRERITVRAGQLRIALSVLGVASAWAVESLRPYLWVFAVYVAVAVSFQWMIQRRALRVRTRVLVMGVGDQVFLTFMVHLLGSLTSPLPLVYVVSPVLYATTTPRRHVALQLAGLGVGCYALLVLLEQLELLPYAPGASAPALGGQPDVATSIAHFTLVALCSFATAALTGQLIAALDAANAKLRTLSQQDELTGLYNRRYMLGRLDAELARMRRQPGTPMVAMIDLDGFKRVNDELGHDVGDALLRAVASALLTATRKVDVVARYGGDEFLVLLPLTAPEPEGARVVGARILEQVRKAARAVCPGVPVTASIGTTSLRQDDTALEAVRRVDERLYAAKRAGGDRLQDA
jgi:diguanylate cyclase (GGDEF)-like protein